MSHVGRQLRVERVSANIPGRLLCLRASISRSKLSEIEAGYLAPSTEELLRIRQALRELTDARKEVEAVAQRVGWPI